MLILQHVLALDDLPPHTPVLTLDGGPTLAAPGIVHTGPALLLLTSRPRMRLEIGDLHSRENVRLALSTHLTLEIVDPLRFYLDIVRTPADYDEEQLAAVLSALIATALRRAMVSLSLGELNADLNLRTWLETTIRKGLSEIDLEGRSGLRVEALEAYDLRCDVWDERARARTARYLRNALAAATAPYALVDQAVLEALRDAMAPAPSPIAAPATRAPAGDADPLRTETLHSLLRNPPSHLRPELWRCSLHAGVNTQPACDDQRVYVATRTGEIYAFDLNHGNPAWPQPAQLGVAPGDGMLLAGDLLWIPAHDGVLYALRAATGMIAQRVAIGGRLSSAPLLVGDRLYVSVDVSPDRPDDKTTGQIVAVDPHRGHTLGTWKVSRHGLRARPALFQGALYVGDRQGAFYCLDVARHRVEPLPEVRIGRILSPAAVDARRSQLVVGGSYGVSAVEVSGRVRWTAHPGGTAGGVAAQPLIWKDTVVVGAADGHLHTLYAGDGKIARAPFATGGPIATAPTPVRHLLVFGSNDGSLYALDSTTGQVFWTYRSGHPVSVAPAVAPDDVLIAVDTQGNVNALRWCLTRFVEAAHMAEGSTPPRTEEAIELWLLAQDVEAALQLAEKAQRWDVVARLATDLQLHAKAAEACEHMATAHAGAAQAAVSWQAAGAHWGLANRSEREQACLLKAAELRQAPLLTLRLVDQPELLIRRGATVRIAVVNLTARLAQHARLRCGGHVALHESEEFSVEGHQEHCIDISVTPTRSGSASLELHLTYADSRGQRQMPVELTARLAVAQPPVVENHFHGPAITGEGVIIVRRESGRTLQVRDTEDTLQLGPSTRIVCPHCQQSTVAEAFCNWCGAALV